MLRCCHVKNKNAATASYEQNKELLDKFGGSSPPSPKKKKVQWEGGGAPRSTSDFQRQWSGCDVGVRQISGHVVPADQGPGFVSLTVDGRIIGGVLNG